MIRAFLILWLAVFGPIVLLIFPNQMNPIQRLNEAFSEQFFQQIYSVNFDILSDKLRHQPKDKWSPIIEQYASHFAYPLKLAQLSDYQSDDTLYQSLVAGEVSFLYDDPMALIQRVDDSEHVIYFALNESTELAVLNQAKGTLFLAAEHLRTLPPEQWQQDLARQNQKIPFAISLKTESDLSSVEHQAVRHANNQAVSYLNDHGQVELLAPVVPGTWLHVHDDLSQATQLKLTTAIGLLFFLLISIALVIWVYPLWRDLKRLVRTANEFGNGQLSKRATTSRMSMVSQLGLSFNRMADNIESLIAGQKELTNAVAHDLRTPLYRLRFALEMLDDQDTTPSQREKYRRTVDSSLEDLDHLINQNLLLSRYSRVADISQFAHTHLVVHLEQEIDSFKLEHPELQVLFSCSETLRTQQLLLDKNALLRAFRNLLSNAGRFAEQTIQISFHLSGSHYLISVEDDGHGISDTCWKRIFEPFVQLDNQARGSGQGHGLGLAIVKQIMTWHDGNVVVKHSNLGGAKFVLSWPILTENRNSKL
ncbi:ATP-binding protein [Vibrio sinaloensis]|uniref:ATP-binding protein n=1 Tax=Photobacterium sp. (strain ATCC 43367) TaxID=379097 RepID=UPI0035E5513B